MSFSCLHPSTGLEEGLWDHAYLITDYLICFILYQSSSCYSFSATWESLLLLSHVNHPSAWGSLYLLFSPLQTLPQQILMTWTLSSFRCLLECHFLKEHFSESHNLRVPPLCIATSFTYHIVFLELIFLYFLEDICSLTHWLSLSL